MTDSHLARRRRAEELGRRLATLRELGLQRALPAPIVDDCERLDADTVRLTRAVPAMGTVVSVTALDGSRGRADEAVGRAFEAMHRAVDVFNRHDGATPLSVLNDQGALEDPPPELRRVVGAALGLHGRSGGTFDPTVAPLVDLLACDDAGRARTPATSMRWSPPDPAAIREAAALVGAEHVTLRHRSIRLGRSGARLTLDGIAKGRVVDVMAETLRRHGVGRFLVNAGGDVRVAGAGPRGDAWTIGVRDPNDRGRLVERLGLTDAAVATSGSYEIHFDPDRVHHHIVDADTGISPTRHHAVTVVAPTAMAADALATAAFVMSPPEGMSFLHSQGCAGLSIDPGGRISRSPRWRARTAPGRRQGNDATEADGPDPPPNGTPRRSP